MALAGAKNDTKTCKKNKAKITTHIGPEKTQNLAPKRYPKWGRLFPDDDQFDPPAKKLSRGLKVSPGAAK